MIFGLMWRDKCVEARRQPKRYCGLPERVMMSKGFALIAVSLFLFANCTDDKPYTAIEGAVNSTTGPAIGRDLNEISISRPNADGVQKAYVDPESGERVGPPEHDVPANAEPIEASALSESPEDLEEKPSPVNGGGMMIDLKNRFRSPISATIENNGKIKMGHSVNEKRQ